MSEQLKILKAEIENFKNLKPMEVDFGGKSIMVIGPNESNKSSFIQAIMSPLNSRYQPLEPINTGEERASVVLDIGNEQGVKYTVEMYYSQDNKRGRLVLKDGDGAKVPSPKKSLDAILGNISFDIDQFVSLSKTSAGSRSEAGVKQQIEILKSLLPEETANLLKEIDMSVKGLRKQSTETASQIKTLEAQNKHEFTDEQLKKYLEPKDPEPVKKKLNDIGKAMEKWTEVSDGTKLREEEIERINKLESLEVLQANLNAVDTLEKSIKNPKQQRTNTFMVHVAKFKAELDEDRLSRECLENLLKEVKKGNEWLEKNPKPSTESLMKELEEINEFNAMCEKVAGIKTKHEDIQMRKEQLESIKEELKFAEQEKKAIFAENPLPVKHLSFDEENVLYKGVPFDDLQHPSSTIIGVGVKIAMAMNPNLKVIVIKDGSLLDKKLANGILQMIEKQGYQLFIEMVAWDQDDMEIKFIEKEI